MVSGCLAIHRLLRESPLQLDNDVLPEPHAAGALRMDLARAVRCYQYGPQSPRAQGGPAQQLEGGPPTLEAAMMLLWGLAGGVLPLVYMFSSWLDFANLPFDVPVGLGVGGIALFVGAIWLLHRAHTDLGKRWSPTVEFKDNHALVTEGVYKRIRHPMYAAHVLWGIAQTLLISNLIAGPLALILIFAVLGLRVPREERAMGEQFGEAYRRYMERTGRILPKRKDRGQQPWS